MKNKKGKESRNSEKSINTMKYKETRKNRKCAFGSFPEG